jgi:serine/threonine-protein kinase
MVAGRKETIMSKNCFLEKTVPPDSPAAPNRRVLAEPSPAMPSVKPPPPYVADLKKIDQYDIIYHLATGGMASVFVAQLSGMAGFEKLVAIKVIHRHLSSEGAFVDMFFDEARVAARIEHPNVAQIYSIGEDHGLLYTVGELVLGQSLRAVLKKMREGEAKPSAALVTDICSKVALGLHAAHELRGDDRQLLNVVHRDISPSNILLSYNGDVKLIDFGIAYAKNRWTVTRVGEIKGKPAYMPPEQIEGKPPDRRGDIYSLGVNLYHLATGRVPFPGTIETGIFDKILNGNFPRPRMLDPDLPEALEEVILKAMARDRRQRFATAEQMSLALEAVSRACQFQARQEAIARGMRGLFAAEILDHETKVAQFRQQRRTEVSDQGLDRISAQVKTSHPPRTPVNPPDSALPKGGSPSKVFWVLLGLLLILGFALSGPIFTPSRQYASEPWSDEEVLLASPDSQPVAPLTDPLEPEPLSPQPELRETAPEEKPPEEKTPPSEAAAPMVQVELDISPVNAQVRIDKIAVPKETSQVSMEQDGNLHVLEVKAEGYHSERLVFVVTDPTVLSVSLTPKTHPPGRPSTSPSVSPAPSPAAPSPAATISAASPETSLPSAPPPPPPKRSPDGISPSPYDENPSDAPSPPRAPPVRKKTQTDIITVSPYD